MEDMLNANGLKREIGFFSATILVIANMAGTGIFTTSGFIMAELGNPYALLFCWLIGGVFALCGALCYGELGAMFPRAGGEYVFLRESFGRLTGFLSGWISLVVGFSAPIAAASIAFSTYFFRAFSIPPGPDVTFALWGVDIATLSPSNVTAIGVIVLFSMIHYHSVPLGSRVQNGLSIFKIALVIIFIAAGLCLGKGSAGHFCQFPDPASISGEKFAVSLIFVSFAYSGWNASAYLGGEIRNPRRNIPLSLIAGTLVVICFYLLLNVVYIYALPAGEMKGVLDVGAKSALFLFGGNIGNYFSGAVALGVLSVLSAMIMTGPRVYYAMSKDSIFFERFGRLDRIRRTPASSIFLQAVIAAIMVITASFDTLLIYVGFTLSLFAMLSVMGMMRLRRTRPPVENSYRTFGYPITPLLFILGNSWIIFFSVKSRPTASLFGLGTIGVGMLLFFIFSERKSQRKQSPVILQRS